MAIDEIPHWAYQDGGGQTRAPVSRSASFEASVAPTNLYTAAQKNNGGEEIYLMLCNM